MNGKMVLFYTFKLSYQDKHLSYLSYLVENIEGGNPSNAFQDRTRDKYNG